MRNFEYNGYSKKQDILVLSDEKYPYEVVFALKQAEKMIIQQRKEIEKLKSLSRTDDLTGLYNKRAFNESFDRALSECRRTGENGVVAIIDLNGFKEINDTFGHLAGDEALKYATKILKANTRNSDLLCRIGGDEFAIIMPRATADKIKYRIDRLKKVLKESFFYWGDNMISISASIGIKEFSPKDNAVDIINEADIAMYMNKKARENLTGIMACE